MEKEHAFHRFARVASFVVTIIIVGAIWLLYSSIISTIFNADNQALNSGHALYGVLDFTLKFGGLVSI